MISAPRKSSGKTTLTLGISSALMQRGMKLCVFKKGPDYIDPMWHKAVTGRACYNIDPYWMDSELCRKIFLTHSSGMDFSLVEGNHGLHDGLDLEGNNSSAYLAKILEIPVVLVVDSSGTNRGVAAVVLGHQLLDPEVTIAGVVLNNVSSPRQIQKQVAAIEHYCGIPVLGALPTTTNIRIKERHLGLITVHETSLVEEAVAAASEAVNQNCDLDKIQAAAGSICPVESDGMAACPPVQPRTKIGVAFDKAFCFYYQDNLDALGQAGAELVFFDTLNDRCLPEVDAIYIGGGFPESFLPELENNRALRSDLRAGIESGMPVYAECGGLMYLTRSIEREGEKKEMVGAIPADVHFQTKPVGKGYIELNSITNTSWLHINRLIKGHEFHYSRLSNIGSEIEYKYQVRRGMGIDGKYDGIVYKNVLASYAHIHSASVPEWASQFVDYVVWRKNR
ncbi:MAG: hydrogenobyrinic acid a,c-diamide synthase (glutamine-hydrolyzing) [Proteobacteria bacterium]|nr:hydrogenobyrinic acid a,c-diamide synthase (glutamine-hydrolyzing) [Pseudomonadota bacterium]